MATLEATREEITKEVRENFLHALAHYISHEHNLPRRDALLVLTDSILDSMNASK